MRNITWLILAILFLSCNNDDAAAPGSPADTIMAEEDIVMPPAPLPWVAEYDTTKNEFFLKQQRTVSPDSVSAEKLINDLNAFWDQVKLQFVKISHDTLYVAIPNSDYLGSQMGSAGAASYMASTTYNLTEIKGIQYVNYDMPTGDHVSPGTFSRKSFENFR
jgi:hypothetical protein